MKLNAIFFLTFYDLKHSFSNASFDSSIKELVLLHELAAVWFSATAASSHGEDYVK